MTDRTVNLPKGASLLKALTTWNNLLLLPLFTLVVLETSRGNTEQLVDFELVNVGFCAFFFAEWAIGLAIAADRATYLRSATNTLDLLSSIPFGYLFQGARLVRLLRLVRLARVFFRVRRVRGRGTQALRLVGVLFSTTFAGALALRIVEPATVPKLEDALWWSLTTVTTVGYGDVTPVTGPGRTVAAVLMTAGIGVFGYVAGIMTAWLRDPEEDEILSAVRRLERQVANLVEVRTDNANDLPG